MIITHTSPDWDAIGAVWLLKRYGGMEGAEVAFVNTGNPDKELLTSATAVVDTGREYDPARLRFDHHQFVGQDANNDSATSLVYADVINPLRVYWWLDPLVYLIKAGDTGRTTYGADWSRVIGIHALLSALKARRDLDDNELLEQGMWALDLLAEHLRARAEAKATLEKFTVYKSIDGLVLGLQGAPLGATFAAYEEGARLVVFTSESPGTVSVGIMRGGEGTEPDCGAIVTAEIDRCQYVYPSNDDCPICTELARWFQHPAGFFAGRGTAKAPDPTPLTADFTALCRALDEAWPR